MLATDLDPATTYDPASGLHRRALALQLQAMLREAGFAHEPTRPGREEVWARYPHEQIALLVYTSIAGGAVRAKDADAIRVVAVYRARDGKERPIVREHRTFRTGTLGAVVDRTRDRMRDAWKAAARPGRCKRCGAPTFTSKAGNTVCAEICWKRSE